MNFVNIRCNFGSWILERFAKELSLKLENSTINGNDYYAIEYCIPYSQHQKINTGKIRVGFFTHFETGTSKAQTFITSIPKFNHLIAMSRNTAEILAKYKAAKQKIEIIHLGTDQPSKKIIFGVCGRVYPGFRKNEHFISFLVQSGFSLLAWGEGWPCPIFSADSKDLSEFYKQIDYLIVPSAIEGGPVPVLEAIAAGVPVIAPDVGWCWDYPVIRYQKNCYESLKATCYQLANPRTWQQCANEHQVFFERLLR